MKSDKDKLIEDDFKEYEYNIDLDKFDNLADIIQAGYKASK